MINAENAPLYRAYFKANPGPVKREEYDAWRAEHPEFTFGFTTVKGVRTRLIRAGVLEPTAEEKVTPKKPGPPGTPLGSLLRTKRYIRTTLHRTYGGKY